MHYQNVHRSLCSGLVDVIGWLPLEDAAALLRFYPKSTHWTELQLEALELHQEMTVAEAAARMCRCRRARNQGHSRALRTGPPWSRISRQRREACRKLAGDVFCLVGPSRAARMWLCVLLLILTSFRTLQSCCSYVGLLGSVPPHNCFHLRLLRPPSVETPLGPI